MKIPVIVGDPGDRLYLIDWKKVLALGIPHNQETARAAQNVQDGYLRQWFQGGVFLAPSFQFTGPNANTDFFGKVPSNGLDFLGGRHRTEVLAKHTDHIPMSVSINEHFDSAKIDQIAIREMVDGEEFELPYLPFITP